eukprot:2953673-Prymnesium_polylepis.1
MGSAGLVFRHLPAPAGVEPLICDPANGGAVFQAASQFNCLEMVDQRVTPEHGITIYADDRTQGPKCAMACPAATVYRNYLHKGGQGMQQQVDCLDAVGGVVENDGGGGPRYWRMQNGYALPPKPGTIKQLGGRLRAEAGLAERARAGLK